MNIGLCYALPIKTLVSIGRYCSVELIFKNSKVIDSHSYYYRITQYIIFSMNPKKENVTFILEPVGHVIYFSDNMM